MSGEEPTPQMALVESSQMVSSVKLHILKKGEYTLWSMRMEQYLTNTNYGLWQVIMNGDEPVQTTRDESGVEIEVPPKTDQAILARQRERKAKSITLLAIPDEYQLRFHTIKDAKSLWDAIKKDTNSSNEVNTANGVSTTDNALIVQNGLGYDWSYIAQEEPTEFALMAYTSGSDTKEKITVLEFEVKDTGNAITRLTNQLDQTSKEKEDLKAKLKQFKISSKNLNKLINSQLSAKDKIGLIYEDQLSESDSEVLPSVFDSRSSDGDNNPTNDRFKKGDRYHVVPPPLTGNYMPPLADLSFAGLDDSLYRPTANKASASISKGEPSIIKTSNISVEMPKVDLVRTSRVMIKDWVCDDEDTLMDTQVDSQTTVKPSFKKIEFTKAKNESVKLDKQGDKPKMVTQNSKGNPQQALKYKGMFDIGCSRHMTGNKALLTDYQDIDGGFVSFGGSTKGGKITSICKIRTNKIDFEDVFFVKELKFNLFSVSQMCNKKNNVFFSESECLVLSLDFMLFDERQVLLRVLRQNNMYRFDLKNFVPFGDLTCLFPKATIDESNLWHRRLGHVNFKTMNKLMKENLVRGLPSNTFENDHTCVACQKEKQHKASCKAKLVSSISQPLQMLHMDLFGPTSIRSINHKTYCLVVTDEFNGLARVLVTKPHNKTPYELTIGRPPSISFMRPFRCHVTILNTLDPLGKFDGKAKEGFLVGYSVNSKAFRVFNTQTKKVKKNLHVNFLENKLNVAGKGPNWLFDIDSLANSMNYQLVTAGNQATKNAGHQEVNGDTSLKKDSSDDKAGDNIADDDVGNEKVQEPVSEYDQALKNILERMMNQEKEATEQSDNVRKEFQAQFNTASASRTFIPPHDPLMLELEDSAEIQTTGIFSNAYDKDDLETNNHSYADESVGAEADFNNMESSTVVSPIPTTTVHYNHPKAHIIGDPMSAVQTRAMQEELLQFKIQKVWTLVNLPYGKKAIEDIDYDEVFAPVARVEAIILFLAFASYMNFPVYQMDVKSAFLYGTIEEEVYVDDIIFGSTKKSLCDEFEKIMHNIFQMSSMGELTFFLGLQVQHKEDGIFIDQDTYIGEFLKKFGFFSIRSASTPMETHKPLTKDENAKVKKVNDEVRIQALVDGKRVNIKESSIRGILRLNEAEGTSCLTNSEIFEGLARMGYEKPSDNLTFYKVFFSPQWKFLIYTILQCLSAKTTSWNEFSSTMASAIICLATNQKFNFSRYILLSLVKNIKADVSFFMFPRFVQLIINHQQGDMTHHKDIFDTPSLIKKVFANMKRVGTRFSGEVTSLLDNMLKHKPKRKHTKEPEVPPTESQAKHNVPLPSPSYDPLPSGEDSLKLKELIELCIILSNKVLALESEVIDIKSTYKVKIEKLERMVERLKEANRVLKELKGVHSIVESNEPVMKKEESSKQGRKIAVIDANVEINLEKVQAEAYNLDLDHQEKVLSMLDVNDEEPASVEEVVEVVTAAKLITEVVTTARVVVNAASVQDTPIIVAKATKATVEVPKPRKRRGVIILGPEETTTTVSVQPKVQAKDKEKVILIKEPKPLKRPVQIDLNEEVARRLEAKLNADIN
nr:ribonuclease H-like domain-containing protein [Tanacetum cinerariifolium]